MSERIATPCVCLACSVFRNELEELRRQGAFALPVRWLDSSLHLEPPALREALESEIAKARDAGLRVLLLYGDCHPSMLDAEAPGQVARTEGLNCCQIMLGRDRFRWLRRQGAFFLMPEWTMRWREVLPKALGLEQGTAKTLMGEMFTKLVYLDTGLAKVPVAQLDEVAAYTGLPWEIAAIDLRGLRSAVESALARLR